jgi:hypothetical protein
VLVLRGGEIDGLAVDKGDFAMDDGGTDGARDGGEHGEKWSLHENFLRDSGGVYTLAAEFERGANRMGIWSKVIGVVLASALTSGGPRAANGSAGDEKKTAAVDEVFSDLTRAGSPGCALGVLPGRKDALFERIWAGESRRARADITADRV